MYGRPPYFLLFNSGSFQEHKELCTQEHGHPLHIFKFSSIPHSCILATVRPVGFYISSMTWPQEDGPLGKSLPIQTLEGVGGHLGREVQCFWYGKHGPKRKMYELAGCVLMTPQTIAPLKGTQLEESLRRSFLCTDLRAGAHLSGYDQCCLCLTLLILITSLSIPRGKQNKIRDIRWIQVFSKKTKSDELLLNHQCLWTQDVIASFLDSVLGSRLESYAK